MRKTYHAVVRGFVDEEGSIDVPLEVAGLEFAGVENSVSTP